MKLWHDDVRPLPDGWDVWARTNDAAKELLKTGEVEEISLDHDLGYDGPPPGECEACHGLGRDLTFTDAPPCTACDGDGFIGGDVLYIAGNADETGHDLVEWMVEEGRVPDTVTIHSWNPDGAKRMARTLRDAGYACRVHPYELGVDDVNFYRALQDAVKPDTIDP